LKVDVFSSSYLVKRKKREEECRAGIHKMRLTSVCQSSDDIADKCDHNDK
jgi:hypothetical protein